MKISWLIGGLLPWLLMEFTSGTESFFEELLLKPFLNGHVLAEFNFVLRASPSKCRDHFNLVPRVVGEFFHEHRLRELDFTLARGVWRTKQWGYPAHPAPAGAKVAARFQDDGDVNVVDVDWKWKRLTNALSGQFCASLNFLDSTQTTQPDWSLQPLGVIDIDKSSRRPNNDSRFFRYGTLPGENLCTENMTPWKKLLPCGGKRGLATLLNARSIQRSHYHSIGLTLRKICPNATQENCLLPLVELRQHVTLVFDPSTFPENKNNKRSNNDGFVKLNSNDWSVTSLFGMGLTSRCSLAEKSNVYVVKPNVDLVSVQPEGSELKLGRDESLFTFDLEQMLNQAVHNIHVRYDVVNASNSLLLLRAGTTVVPKLSVSRYQTGYGQEKGGIVTQLENNGRQNLTVVFLDVIPWFLRVYLHTLKIVSVSGRSRREISPLLTRFTPGLDRSKPYTLEVVLELEALSTTRISIDFERSVLKWNEYPPDANRGFHVGAGMVSALLGPGGGQDRFSTTHLLPKYSTYAETFSQWEKRRPKQILVQLYSESLLINLPTPDFSMPYNVICLTCTVVALAFGPLVNLTTKSLQLVPLDAEANASSTTKIKKFLSKVPFVNRLVKLPEEAQLAAASKKSDETVKDG